MSMDVLALVEKKKAAWNSAQRLLDEVTRTVEANDCTQHDLVNDLLRRLVAAKELFNTYHFSITEKLDPESSELEDMGTQADELRQAVEKAYADAQVWFVKAPHSVKGRSPDQTRAGLPDAPEVDELIKHAGDAEKMQQVAVRIIRTLKGTVAERSRNVDDLQESIQTKNQQLVDDATHYQAQIDQLEEQLNDVRRTSTPAKGAGKAVSFEQSRMPTYISNPNQNEHEDTMSSSVNNTVIVDKLLKRNTDMVQSFITENRRHQQQYRDSNDIPKTELTMFDGNALQYWPFIKSFDDIIGNSSLKPSKKLNALITHCETHVQRVIKSCQLMTPEAGYIRARALLRAKYGNPFHISQAWIGHMRAYPRLETPLLLQSFAEDLVCCRLTLSEMGYVSELSSTENLTSLSAKLPRFMRGKWRKVNRNSLEFGSSARLDDLVDIVTHAADEANDPIFNEERLDSILAHDLAAASLTTTDQNPAPSKPTSHHKTRYNKENKARHVNVIDESPTGQGNEPHDDQADFDSQIVVMMNEVRRGVCAKCRGPHYTQRCSVYLALSPGDRLQFARDRKLCLLCLSTDHFLQACTQPWKCNIQGCQFRHNKTLHDAFGQTIPKPNAVNMVDEGEIEVGGEPVVDINDVEIYATGGKGVSLLPIAPCYVQGPKGMCSTYVLQDSGSTTSIITKALFEELGLMALGSTMININTVVGKQVVEGEIVDVGIVGAEGRQVLPAFELITLPSLPISTKHVATAAALSEWPHLATIQLPKVDASKVGILIGQDNAHLLEPLQKIKGDGMTDPFAVKTPLGWTVFGLKNAAPAGQGSVNACVTDCDGSDKLVLDQLLANQWRIDKVPEVSRMSKVEQAVIQRWEDTYYIKDGHFFLEIPFKREPPCFPPSKKAALACLKSLDRKLFRDPVLHKKYTACMKKNLDRGYVELAPQKANLEYEFFLTHHAVEHARKPDVARSVMNGKHEVQGISLNKMVHQGPDLTNKMVKVILNFRIYPVAFTGDVEQMYYQVYVPPHQREALKFVWHEDGDLNNEPTEYQMTTQMFGGTWSPCAAMFAMNKTTEVFGAGFEEIVKETIKKFFYVDDCLRSLPEVIKVIQVILGVRKLLASAGFNFTKLTSNSVEVLEALPIESRAAGFRDLDLDSERAPVEHTLGSRWHPNPDIFAFVISFKEAPDTRRGMASSTATVYDPMGLCGPVIIQARKLGQILAKRKLDWDDNIPPDILVQWNRWKEEIVHLNQYAIDRWVKYTGIDQRAQLHLFSDASETAYGAVCYFCVINAEDKIVHSNILIARCRLAPIKVQTIPRLELCAAQTAANLERAVTDFLEIELLDSIFWTDSTLVLRYLAGDSANYKTFVANRVADIQETTDITQWHYVPTQLNPADIISRGMGAREFATNALWKHGPPYLLDTGSWPSQPEFLKTQVPEEEVKREKVVCLVTKLEECDLAKCFSEYYSSWERLVRSVAWLHRFLRYRASQGKDVSVQPNGIDADEYRSAELAVFRLAQRLDLTDSEQKAESYKRLSPVLLTGIVCVGGRLEKSQLPKEFKHPIILPQVSHLTTLYIRHCHESVYHSGVDRTLMETRGRTWILGGRQPIRKVVGSCVICKRFKEKPQHQYMADLPAYRVTPNNAPFTTCGLDYMGPIPVKLGRSEVKRWVCVVTCAVTRAVHIELAADLTASAFLNVLNRFIGRRGKPEKVISDNGTNFVGAHAELQKLLTATKGSKVQNFCSKQGIQWRFNPPGASHHGGFWERQNRTVRGLLMTLTKGKSFSDDALMTFLCQVEYAVNSRPLTRLSDDVTSFAPLTPNHLLLLRPGEAIEGKFFDRDILQRRWRQTMRLIELFWEQWTKLYLSQLQSRSKWNVEQPNLKVGDLVMVAHEATPRMKWPMAVIEDVYPASDGKVRTVKVRTPVGSYVRPITKIVLLESDCIGDE